MSRIYAIKEIYYTLQGEGAHTGRPAVFVRFSGCNLWSGREADRHKAICQFCDTDFWGVDGTNGGKYTADQLIAAILEIWKTSHTRSHLSNPGADVPAGSDPYIVCTGGEPAIQLDQNLVDQLHEAGIEIGIETNGTIALPRGIDWICMSPKANTDIVVRKGDEIKIIYPQKGIDPQDFKSLEFKHFFIQPMDSPARSGNTEAAIAYCTRNPQWKLSLQTHKYLGID